MHNTLQAMYQDDKKEQSPDETDKCKIYIMTKQYLTKEEVLADNGMEIYYDNISEHKKLKKINRIS